MIEIENKPMNVLMVTPRYFPYMGGIETHVHEVGRRLSRNGINLTLLTTIAHHELMSLPKEDIIEGIRVLRVQAWPRQNDYYFAPDIYSVIKNGNWEIIHCQGCHTLVPLLAMLAAKRAHIPYILTFHTGGHSSNWRNRIRGIQWQLLRPLMLDAKKLIGVSLFESSYFRDVLRIPAKKFALIPNGTTTPEIPPDCLKVTSSSLIISVGRLEKYKGHQRLITALPKILEQRPDVKLLLLGKGPYELALRKLAQEIGVAEHVTFRSVPPTDRQAMAEQLSQAALVALLSDYEAHPIAIMEALAVRRPVLVTDTSGLRELAEQGLARAIPLKSSPEEVAAAALMQMETPLSSLYDFNLPTWDDCAHQLQTIYESVVRKSVTCVS